MTSFCTVVMHVESRRVYSFGGCQFSRFNCHYPIIKKLNYYITQVLKLKVKSIIWISLKWVSTNPLPASTLQVQQWLRNQTFFSMKWLFTPFYSFRVGGSREFYFLWVQGWVESFIFKYQYIIRLTWFLICSTRYNQNLPGPFRVKTYFLLIPIE